MAVLIPTRAHFLQAVSQLHTAIRFFPSASNSSAPRWADDFVEGEPVWSLPRGRARAPARKRLAHLSSGWSRWSSNFAHRLASGPQAATQDLLLYEDAVLHLLYQRYYPRFYEAGFGSDRRHVRSAGVSTASSWPTGVTSSASTAYACRPATIPRHTFACFRQIQRAFEQIFRDIIGGSMPAARLRAAVWQSIFTHDMRRYRRTFYARMGDFATLITGPSGTGKEIAARAIAQSRYLPFDERKLTFRRRRRRLVLSHQYLGALADAGGIGAVRPSPRRVHRRDRRPQRLARNVSRARARCSSTSWAISIRRFR